MIKISRLFLALLCSINLQAQVTDKQVAEEKKIPESVVKILNHLFAKDKLCELQFNKHLFERLTGLQSESPLTLYVWQNQLHLAQWDETNTSFFIFDGKKSWLIQLPTALSKKKHAQWSKQFPRTVFRLSQAKTQILDLIQRLKHFKNEPVLQITSTDEGKVLVKLKPQPPYIQDLHLEFTAAHLKQIFYKDDLDNSIRLSFEASQCRKKEKKDQQWFLFQPKSNELVTEL